MSEQADLKRTPLWDAHRRLGARMVPFGGWDMPVQYATGILAEAKAVRTTAGLFDVSHMGRLEVHGPTAREALESLTPNVIGKLALKKGHYTLFLNERGGVIDDLIVYCQEPNLYKLIVNASNTEKDCAWIQSHLPAGSVLTNRTPDTALLALQGPLAVTIMAAAGAPEASEIRRFERVAVRLFNNPAWAMRTGYTGEDGFEIQCSATSAENLWNALLRVAGPNLVPCGLGARDVLRIEAAYPLYGHEIDDDCNPWEAGLGWVLKKTEGFIGAEALARLKESQARQLVGLTMETRSVARQGATVLAGDRPCGEVVSGTFSPNVNASIALAYVDRDVTDETLTVESGGRRQNAARTPLPFVDLPVARKKKPAGLTSTASL
ncbi:MAG: glycine cleavage system aminomethyltransferase GcvT [Armatimonadetes bacterium]|nr:glycine cleavage system aminomethyltransferase GcvT [Armatimonadota bacterium]